MRLRLHVNPDLRIPECGRFLVEGKRNALEAVFALSVMARRGAEERGSKKENIIPRPKEEQRSLRHLDLMNTTKESGGTECMSKKKGRSPLFIMSPFLTFPRPERS